MDTVRPQKTLVEQTYDILVDAICSGEIRPGERLNQDEIAERLNVSRQPVNSAISILKSNGLVADSGRRGVVVTQFDPALFHAIFEYRAVIEPFAVRIACARIGPGHVQQAEKVLNIGDKAIARGKLTGLVQADVMFHEMIYDWSGNQVIEKSMRLNWHHIRRSMAEVLREPDAVIPIWKEHRAIVEQMLDGQIEEAAETMKNHIQKAYQEISKAVQGRD